MTLDREPDEPLQLVQFAVAETSVVVSIDVDDEVMAVRLDVDDGSATGRQILGQDLRLRVGHPLEWQVYADPFLGGVDVFLDGRWAAYTEIPMGDEAATTVGTSGSVTSVPVSTPVCDRVHASAEQGESSP